MPCSIKFCRVQLHISTWKDHLVLIHVYWCFPCVQSCIIYGLITYTHAIWYITFVQLLTMNNPFKMEREKNGLNSIQKKWDTYLTITSSPNMNIKTETSKPNMTSRKIWHHYNTSILCKQNLKKFVLPFCLLDYTEVDYKIDSLNK